ncbi:aminotransferase class V-fold PLP-dependent enzyme, partial [Candidatus Omnitrophota bacterium]
MYKKIISTLIILSHISGQAYALRPISTELLTRKTVKTFDTLTYHLTVGLGDRKTIVRLYAPWYCRDKLVVRSDIPSGKSRLYANLDSEPRQYLELSIIDDQIAMAFFDRDSNGSPTCDVEWVPLNTKKTGGRLDQGLGSLERYACGRRLIDAAMGIAESGMQRRENVFSMLSKFDDDQQKSRLRINDRQKLRRRINDMAIKLGRIKLQLGYQVADGITPLSVLGDRPRNTRFFAIIDEHDPENYMVFEITENGVKVFGENDQQFFCMPDKRRSISLSALIDGAGFMQKVSSRRVLYALEVDQITKEGTIIAHKSLTRGLAVNLTPSQVGDGSRFWIQADGDIPDENGENVFVSYLVDMDIIHQVKLERLPSLEDIDGSSGRFVAFEYEKYTHPEWLYFRQNGSIEFFHRITGGDGSMDDGSQLEEDGRRYAVYRRIDSDDRITSIRISEDRKEFTIEGLKINDEPVVLQANHIHLSAFLYVIDSILKDDNPARVPTKIKDAIHISPNLRALIPDEDDIIRQGKGKLATSFSYQRGSGWIASSARTARWVTRSQKHDVRRALAMRNINEVKESLLVGLKREIMPELAQPEDGEKASSSGESILSPITELKSVMEELLKIYSNVHRGNGIRSSLTSRLFDMARVIIMEYAGLSKDEIRNYVLVFGDKDGFQKMGLTYQKEMADEDVKYFVISSNELGLPIGIDAVVMHRNFIPDVPVISGGGTVMSVREDDIAWENAPARFEAGTPHIVGAITLAKALLMIKEANDPGLFRRFARVAQEGDIFADDLDRLNGQQLLDALIPLLLRHDNGEFINLDNAASTPTFEPIWDVAKRALRLPVQQWPDLIKRVRSMACDFFKAPEEDFDLIFANNTTRAINMVSMNLASMTGSQDIEPVIVNSILEHNSNELPWRNIDGVSQIRLGVDKRGFYDMDELERLLREYNLENKHGKKRIVLLALNGASNILGTINDVTAAAALAHQYGAEILIDAAQLAPHRQIKMQEWDIDYLAFSAHKMYAPFGSGGLMVRRKATQYKMLRAAALKTKDMNIVGIAAMGKALDLLGRIGMELLQAHEMELTAYAIEQLSQIEGVKLYGITDPKEVKDKTGVVMMNFAQ